jgi:hypothetical protein
MLRRLVVPSLSFPDRPDAALLKVTAEQRFSKQKNLLNNAYTTFIYSHLKHILYRYGRPEDTL